jgi:hypothetical protein
MTDPATEPHDANDQLSQLQRQIEQRSEELATAEAQRDETAHQLEALQNRLAAERQLAAAGVRDVETASLLLEKRGAYEDAAPDQLTQAVTDLLNDKPALLAAPQPPMPPMTASGRDDELSTAAQLARVARRAAISGNRRDVAEYLRLRRQQLNDQ